MNCAGVPAPPVGFFDKQVRNQTWWLRVGSDAAITTALERASRGEAETLAAGRGDLQRVVVDTLGTGILRRYQRGGLVRFAVRDLYWDWPPRPMRELVCTEAARRRGVPVVEVLAAGVDWLTPPSLAPLCLYRGFLLTREAEGYVNLWRWLCGRPSPARCDAMVRAVADCIARLHRAGVEHRDLNLTNVLLREAATRDPVLLLDFDRARLQRTLVTRRRRTRGLRRLQRSLDKLDPRHEHLRGGGIPLFCESYLQSLRQPTPANPCHVLDTRKPTRKK